MINPNTSARLTGQDRPVSSRQSLEDDTLARLELLAAARGITINEVMQQLIEAEATRSSLHHPASQPLTPKQHAVLSLLKTGLSVKEIADRMGVSEQTVRTHIHRARTSLGCTDILSLRFQ